MKLSQLHESATPGYYLKTKDEIMAWLKEHADFDDEKLEGCFIDDKLRVYLTSSFHVNPETSEVPFKLQRVAGMVSIADTNISTLEWLPTRINGSLKLTFSNVSTLKGISKVITGGVDYITMYNMKLRSGLLELAMVPFTTEAPLQFSTGAYLIGEMLKIIDDHIREFGPKQKVLELRKKLIAAGFEEFL